MRKAAIFAGLAAFAATSALAQSSLTRKQERDVVGVISEAEGECERVDRTQAIGQVDRNTFVAVACTNGTEYVIVVDQRARLAYYATCSEFEEANNNLIRCFV